MLYPTHVVRKNILLNGKQLLQRGQTVCAKEMTMLHFHAAHGIPVFAVEEVEYVVPQLLLFNIEAIHDDLVHRIPHFLWDHEYTEGQQIRLIRLNQKPETQDVAIKKFCSDLEVKPADLPAMFTAGRREDEILLKYANDAWMFVET